jgi:hypothetical protein
MRSVVDRNVVMRSMTVYRSRSLLISSRGEGIFFSKSFISTVCPTQFPIPAASVSPGSGEASRYPPSVSSAIHLSQHFHRFSSPRFYVLPLGLVHTSRFSTGRQVPIIARSKQWNTGKHRRIHTTRLFGRPAVGWHL